MVLSHRLTLLPLVVAADDANIFDNAKTNANRAVAAFEGTNAGTTTSAPIEECGWADQLTSSDADSSGGLSQSEYFSFLTSIDDPPYVSEYFGSFESFEKLPWALRVVHKSLACHCQQLGFGEGCCEGDDVEVPIPGSVGNESVDERRTASYRDMFCKMVSYAVEDSVPSPHPTLRPSAAPTQSPSDGPTESPSTGAPTESPSTDSPSADPTGSPSPAPVTPAPTESPAMVPTAPPTAAPSLQPTQGEVIAQFLSVPENPTQEGGGIGVGGIAGVAVAVPALLLAVVALLVHRRKEEGRQLRKFAGEQAPEEDLEAPSTAADEDTREPEPEASREPRPAPPGPGEDDESSAPSVWSEGDDEEGGALSDISMHDYHEAPGMGAGSSLAAMGVASTVAANWARNSPGAQFA